MTKVSRLPGRACAHYAAGGCLYEERLNPGYRRDYRCVLWAGAETAFDDFLHRAERFGLDEAKAARIWRRRTEGAAHAAAPRCPHDAAVQPHGLVADDGCAHCLDGLCVKNLPPCPGVCDRFVRAQTRAT